MLCVAARTAPQTVKYNTKKRAGRGFTLEELKASFASHMLVRCFAHAFHMLFTCSSVAVASSNSAGGVMVLDQLISGDLYFFHLLPEEQFSLRFSACSAAWFPLGPLLGSVSLGWGIEGHSCFLPWALLALPSAELQPVASSTAR